MNSEIDTEEWLRQRGFRAHRDLGINMDHVFEFFFFADETHVFDEAGVSWIVSGYQDPGDLFNKVDPVLWEIAA